MVNSLLCPRVRIQSTPAASMLPGSVALWLCELCELSHGPTALVFHRSSERARRPWPRSEMGERRGPGFGGLGASRGRAGVEEGGSFLEVGRFGVEGKPGNQAVTHR